MRETALRCKTAIGRFVFAIALLPIYDVLFIECHEE